MSCSNTAFISLPKLGNNHRQPTPPLRQDASPLAPPPASTTTLLPCYLLPLPTSPLHLAAIDTQQFTHLRSPCIVLLTTYEPSLLAQPEAKVLDAEVMVARFQDTALS